MMLLFTRLGKKVNDGEFISYFTQNNWLSSQSYLAGLSTLTSV